MPGLQALDYWSGAVTGETDPLMLQLVTAITGDANMR